MNCLPLLKKASENRIKPHPILIKYYYLQDSLHPAVIFYSPLRIIR